MSIIMPAFETFQEEGKVVGRLLVGYGELELGLCFCVAEAREDFNAVFKAMFRPRGETQRIDIADALGREPFRAAKLATPFEEAIGAIRYCLKIRNQYAHSYWTDKFGKCLAFAELEDLANRNNPVTADMMMGEAKDIDLPTAETQEGFFIHTRACLDYLQSEFKFRAGKLSSPIFAAPKKVPRPPLCKP